MMTLTLVKVWSPLASILHYSYEYYILRASTVSVCMLLKGKSKPVIFFFEFIIIGSRTPYSIYVYEEYKCMCVCIYIYMTIHIILCVYMRVSAT